MARDGRIGFETVGGCLYDRKDLHGMVTGKLIWEISGYTQWSTL